jgi:hypothetical protein
VPLPDAPDVMVIQDTLVVVVHAQPAAVVTSIVPFEAAAVSAMDAGVSVSVHAAPACVTVSVCPPTVIVPVRPVVEVFAATL